MHEIIIFRKHLTTFISYLNIFFLLLEKFSVLYFYISELLDITLHIFLNNFQLYCFIDFLFNTYLNDYSALTL